MNTIVYTRVSTSQQQTDRQKEDINAFCKAYNYNIVKEFDETGSGFEKERPVLQEMLQYIEKNYKDIDLLIVHELSRLGRTQQVLDIIDNLNKKSICLYSYKDKLSTLNDDKTINETAKLTIGIMSSINTYEVETMRFRMKSGQRKKLSKGGAPGGAFLPYGYCKIEINKEKKLVIDKDEAKVIEKIFELYLKGNGTQKISNILNDKGIFTKTQIIEAEKNKTYLKFKKKWVDGVIYNILKNTIYIGKRRVKNSEGVYEFHKIPDLQIINEDDFNQAQELLHTNFNKKDKHNKYSYLLDAQKIKCGVCSSHGLNNHYYAHQRANKKDNAYKCISKRYNENCGNVSIGIPRIEDALQRIIIYMFTDQLKENIDDTQIKEQIKDIELDIKFANEKLIRLNKKHEKLIDMRLEENISPESFNHRVTKIKNEIKAKQNDIRLFNNRKIELNRVLLEMKDIINLKEKYLNSKIPKDLVNKIINTILIYRAIGYKEQFTNKQDNVVLLKISIIDGREFEYLISQRSEQIFLKSGSTLYTIPKVEEHSDSDWQFLGLGVTGIWPDFPEHFNFPTVDILNDLKE